MALALATPFLPVSLSAFVFGLVAIGLSYFLAQKRETLPVVSLILAVIPVILGVSVLLLFSWRLNVLALGDDEARSVGVDPGRNKGLVLLMSPPATWITTIR